ncbi:metallophosphoesterase family protein [Brucella pseudogrignonensis]|uniref:metallophosphoesterase family protein n=1 Tax=Brucella pseudogrignonensis TaxID=419475 RepID=UPI00124DB96A|nr:metallophosphoesterase [Brucella pseudogrignonensis]KAB2686785.1 metallophosphoesterase [Brucella pseudogrignonensis]
MLPKIRFLQIGDIHLPSNANAKPFVDDKDATFPIYLRNIMSKSPIKSVFKRIYQVISSEKIDNILLMGDFTDYGKIDGYKSCVNYLSCSLQIGKYGINKNIPIGIVPGNHDIDRNLAKKPGINTKFNDLIGVLNSAGFPPIPLSKPIRSKITNGSAESHVFLLNSCWGCGEETFIPDHFRSRIVSAIDETINLSKTDGPIKEYYNQQLDTPAFSEECIDSIVSEVQSLPPSAIPILVAHHNLLPQRRPRLAPYTELVNGGALRGALEELDRPVIYLHGHIHEDPIEVMQLPGAYPLVSISAPEISQGFNVIEVVFGQSAFPLACHITPYRIDKSGILKRSLKIAIPLNNGRRRSAESSMGVVYAKILEARQLYWPDLESYFASHPAPIDVDRLTMILEQLLAEGSISIDNYDIDRSSWIVKAEM